MRRLIVAINIGLLTLFLLLLSTSAPRAWARPVPKWAGTYGGIGDDAARSVEQTSDGGFIVAGGTGSFGAGFWDAWVLRLDSKGNIGPGCSVIGLSSAVVASTLASRFTTTATVTSSAATVASTSVTGTPNSATTSVQRHHGSKIWL